jgi:hypothetical protein
MRPRELMAHTGSQRTPPEFTGKAGAAAAYPAPWLVWPSDGSG